jgi:hypothetical protein
MLSPIPSLLAGKPPIESEIFENFTDTKTTESFQNISDPLYAVCF